MISMIVAHDKNNAIGKKNSLPWEVPEDLRFFSKITKGKTVVMGENTYYSIGKPLPNRINIIISNNLDLEIEGAFVINEPKLLLETSKFTDVFVIGGGQIYKFFLPYAETLYVTKLDLELEGADTFFPSYEQDFECLIDGKEEFSEKQGINYKFTLWRKK